MHGVLCIRLNGRGAGLKIVLLVGHSPEGEVQHRYVATRIAERFPSELKAIIVATGVPKTRAQRLSAWWKRYSLPQIGSRIAVRAWKTLTKRDTVRQEAFRRILFPGGDSGVMPRRDILEQVPSHNSAACLALLDRIAPDVVLVYGTLIIGRKVIERSPRILNIHTGLSPRYRGSDTIFWPLHNGEPEHVGVTVHRLEPGIDSGPILATARPAIAPDDTEDTLFAKCVALGADLMCEQAVKEFAGTATPVTQALAEGHEYRSVDRTLASERRTARLLRGGAADAVRRPWVRRSPARCTSSASCSSTPGSTGWCAGWAAAM